MKLDISENMLRTMLFMALADGLGADKASATIFAVSSPAESTVKEMKSLNPSERTGILASYITAGIKLYLRDKEKLEKDITDELRQKVNSSLAEFGLLGGTNE